MAISKDNEIIKSEKSDDTSFFFDRYFHEPIAIVFSHIFIKLGIVPNAITIMSGISGLVAGHFIYKPDFKSNVIGILLFLFGVILDTSDGQVARLTSHCSPFGRMLDGICDTVCFISVYVALSLRLMGETIPFTKGIEWGWYIWPLAVYAGICHQNQAAMSDYFRQIHLMMINTHNELDRSNKIKEELRSMKGCSFKKFYQSCYCIYTAKQEKNTPQLQALLAKLEKGELSHEERIAFITGSRKIIPLHHWESVTPKALLLYILLLTRQYAYFFPALIVFFGLLNQIMIYRYERLAKKILPKG